MAGLFYSSNPIELRKSIKECFIHKLGPGKEPPMSEKIDQKIALITPHAGYIYSGPVAAHGYYLCSALQKIDIIVIVGPNHEGIGSGVATVNGGIWETPLGKIEVDTDLTQKIVQNSDIIDFNESSHRYEHSIEVQIPFLQYIFGNSFKILPISMMLQDISTSIEVGKAIAEVIKDKKCIIIASSDFTHYENHKIVSKKDFEAIKAILKMDVNGLYNVIEKLYITMCGYGPITAIITAAKELKIINSQLLKYATSGDITGDYQKVVGYASIVFK